MASADTTAPSAAPGAFSRAAWLPSSWGLALYVALLAAGLVFAAVWYRGHPDYEQVAWRIVLGLICNAICAILGCYLVLRRMSLLGDAISHAVLPGIVVAFVLSGQMGGPATLIGASVVGLLTAILTQALSATGRVAEDSSMGVVYTGLFAVGVLLVSQLARNAHLDADCVLFGTIDYATFGYDPGTIPQGVYRLGFVLILTIVFVLALWKELKITAFDPALASAMGIPTLAVHYALMVMVSAAAVASFEVVGSILVVAMLIVPAATAALLTQRLNLMILWAVAIGAGSGVIGDLTASYWNTTVAGMMSVVAGLHLAAAVFAAPGTGLFSRWARNLSLAVRIEGEDILARLYRHEEHSPAVVAPRTSSRLLLAWASWNLRSRGLIERDHGATALTEAGRTAARALVRSHRLWETYLEKHFDLPADHLHDPAERMEHFIDERMREELAAELDGRTHDPHGRSIPHEK